VRRVLRAADRAAAVPGASREGIADAVLVEARAIEEEDRAACDAIGRHGLALVPSGARILTHCNTGMLCTAGIGTALGVVIAAHREGRGVHVWVDETRPLWQGARLTAWELGRLQIPRTLLADGAAASLMAGGKVDLVITGADRIAADGSAANKIGTYGLAVLARHHGIPFVIAAPTSTVDLATPTGADIRIEDRDPAEVTTPYGLPVAEPDTPTANPAFDVTPPGLISALVTERGVVREPDAARLRAHLGEA
jgi:methylthioribose-1-phosphate isomerase